MNQANQTKLEESVWPPSFRNQCHKRKADTLRQFTSFEKLFDHHRDIWANKVPCLFIEGEDVPIRTRGF